PSAPAASGISWGSSSVNALRRGRCLRACARMRPSPSASRAAPSSVAAHCAYTLIPGKLQAATTAKDPITTPTEPGYLLLSRTLDKQAACPNDSDGVQGLGASKHCPHSGQEATELSDQSGTSTGVPQALQLSPSHGSPSGWDVCAGS